MDLGACIRRRKSFRQFRMDPLPQAELDGLVDYLSSLEPPAPDIDWNFDTLPYLDMVKLCESEPGVKAPCYLLLRAKRVNFSLQNCGYLGEKAVLYLTGRDIATCWQGSVRVPSNQDFEGSLPFVTAVALGYSDEPFRADPAEADRKPLKKLAYNRVEAYTPLLELARLAPSSFNRQPCVFVSDDRQRIHLFRKQPFLNNPVVSFAQCVDAGAALAELECAAQSQGYSPRVTRVRPEPRFKTGLIYQATVELSET